MTIHHGRSNTWILPLLGSLSIVTAFAMDVYLPAFAQVAAKFKPARLASLWLSSCFVGFAQGEDGVRVCACLPEQRAARGLSAACSGVDQADATRVTL